MEKFFVQLEREPPVRLSCTFVEESTLASSRDTIIVYLNGIDNPQTMWYPTVAGVQTRRGTKSLPPMLMYDRPGQGETTDRNPDGPGRPKGHGHECLSAAHDL